jgi:apolipoprotein N-acyltransferase
MKHDKIVALLAGAATSFSFAPYDLWWLAILAPAFWLALTLDQVPRQTFKLGWLFGIGLMTPGLYWVHHSMSAYADTPYAIAVAVAFLLALTMALYYGLAGYFAARWARTLSSRARLLAMVALFVLGEWLRSWLFSGFPWLLLGYSQIDTLLGAYAPVGGVWLVSLLTMLCAALLVSMTRPGARPRAISMLLMLAIGGGGYLLSQQQWTQEKGQPIRVSMIQGNIPQDEKWLPENRFPTLEFYADTTLELLDSELVIWPESAIPDFLFSVERELIEPLNTRLVESSTTLVTGVLTYPAEATYYNTIFATGHERHFYHKRHLVPFGEYFPLGWLWKGWISGLATMGEDFSEGQAQRPLMQVGSHLAGVSICYEIIFPEEVRESLPDADFLINLSNDGWFGTTTGPLQHFQMARMRSLENGRMTLRSTNTGVTAVIGPDGQTIKQLPQFVRGVLTAEVQPYQGMTPYSRFGIYPAAALVLLLLLAARLSGRDTDVSRRSDRF